ncbi:MAG: cytochrome P450 [Archangium sp.]|nr:cytochrome P450 [Archangium sp.]
MNATIAMPLHTPPTLPGARPLVGVLPQLQRNPLEVMERATLKYGPLTYLPLPTLEGYVLGHPGLVQHVLVTNAKNYVKQTRGYDMLRLVLGNGLVTSDGAFWKRQRRIAQPAFHRERLAGFGEVMTRAANEMVESWEPGKPFDFAAEMMRCTLRVVGETLLSADVTKQADHVGAALTVVLEHLIHRTLHPLSMPEWLPTPTNLRFKRSLEELDRVVLGLIAERRKGGGPRHDLLAMLMESRDPETGEGMTDGQLRDEVMTIFLAGHETTANNLAWTMALLGRAPEVERKMVAEAKGVLGTALPTMADVHKLPYAMNVIRESLRLYPPVWSLGRRVVEDDLVEGYLLPKDALVFISPWAIHRLPEFWTDPLAFDPDRWLVEDPRRAHGSYLPFSMGQRKCIGDTFATVEAQLILTTVMQKVHLSLVPGQTFEPEPVITLRPRGGVHVVATRR